MSNQIWKHKGGRPPMPIVPRERVFRDVAPAPELPPEPVPLIEKHPAWDDAWATSVTVDPSTGVTLGVSLAPVIIRYAAFLGGITEEGLKSPRRMEFLFRPRFLAIWAMREFTPLSTTSIGRRIGNRDHTTVLNGYRRAKMAIASAGIDIPDDDWREAMRRVWGALNPGGM